MITVANGINTQNIIGELKYKEGELQAINDKFIDFTSKEKGYSLTVEEMSQLKDFIENFVTDENLKKNYIRYLEHLESRQENKNRNRVRYSKEWEKFGQSNLSFSEKFDRIMGTIEAKISYMFKAPENSRNIYCTGFDKYRGLGPVNPNIAVDATEIEITNRYNIKEQFLSGEQTPKYVDYVTIETL